MDLSKLQEKLQKCKQSLDESTTDIEDIACNIIQNETVHENDKEDSYSCLSKEEQTYQQQNEEYKRSISHLSPAYLSMSEFYVGPNLPREHKQTFLDSKSDIEQLYGLFMFVGIASMYDLKQFQDSTDG